MSRCFPFPPPGYERKARNEDEELLEKEKHREKKHKKEKREGKEKREKDRNDEKHREKKDKKEKHKDRDKKKDKEDTDKAKEKSKIPDEKRLSGQSDPQSADKLGQKEGKEKNNSVDKKIAGQIGGHKPEKFIQNNNLVDDPKFVKEFGRRIKDDATGARSQLENFSGVDRRKDEGMLRLVAGGPSTLAPGREKDKRVEAKTSDGQGARDGTRPGGIATVQSTDGIVQNKLEGLPRLVDKNVERKTEGIEKIKDKESDDKRGVKSQEKDKEKKSHGKDKDRDREKKRRDREKRKEDKQKKKEDKQRKKEDKEKKKEEKAKEKTQLKNVELEEKAKEKPQLKNAELDEKAKEKPHLKNAELDEKAKEKPHLKNAELNKIRGTSKHDLVDNHAVKTPQLPKESNSSTRTGGNPKKRKDIETNGVLHAPDNLPSKLLRPTPSSHPPMQNGRILEHCQTTVLPSDKKVVSNNIKMDIKDRKINGVTEAQPPSVSPMKVKPVMAAADQAKPSVRPLHPDTRYLSLIYSVPKMEEPSDCDDQEWLFSTNASQPNKPKVGPSGVEETPMVWAEAQQIASADIFALPYVIPY